MRIWKQDATLEGLEQIGKGTMGEHLGIEMVELGDDYLRARMPVDERTVQPMRLLHGGASVALAETLGSVAGVLCLENPTTHTIVGVEINANHLNSVREGIMVYGTARPVRIGRTVQVWQIDITDDQDRLICVSRLTAMVVPIRK
jgi:1,4-dihydroxy-2-naphthoyl-CoA hydrolase